jgi:hypothetical protein
MEIEAGLTFSPRDSSAAVRQLPLYISPFPLVCREKVVFTVALLDGSHRRAHPLDDIRMQLLRSFGDIQIAHYSTYVPDLVEVFLVCIDDFTEGARLGLDRFDLFSFPGELVPKMFQKSSIESVNLVKVAGTLAAEQWCKVRVRLPTVTI